MDFPCVHKKEGIYYGYLTNWKLHLKSNVHSSFDFQKSFSENHSYGVEGRSNLLSDLVVAGHVLPVSHRSDAGLPPAGPTNPNEGREQTTRDTAASVSSPMNRMSRITAQLPCFSSPAPRHRAGRSAPRYSEHPSSGQVLP
jgi:hypothetical protein